MWQGVLSTFMGDLLFHLDACIDKYTRLSKIILMLVPSNRSIMTSHRWANEHTGRSVSSIRK